MHSISSSMSCAHTYSSIASWNVSGSYIGENNAKRENEFGVPASYISCRLLFFASSVDVDLKKILDGVCCPLGVLVGVAWFASCVDVPCVEPCHSVMGFKGTTTDCLTCGAWTTSYVMSSLSKFNTILTFILTVPSHDSFSKNWTSLLMITFLATGSYNLYDFVSLE